MTQDSSGAGSARLPMADDEIGAQTSRSVGFPRGTALVLMGGLIYLTTNSLANNWYLLKRIAD